MNNGIAIIILAAFLNFPANVFSSQNLEIHYINVGQGGATLIVGPNGTRLLYDFGNKSGNKSIVPYLELLGWKDTKYIHYAILSHRDRDHYYGYKGLIEAKFGYYQLIEFG